MVHLTSIKPIFRLIAAELPAREVIVTLDNTLMGHALRYASNRQYDLVSGGLWLTRQIRMQYITNNLKTSKPCPRGC